MTEDDEMIALSEWLTVNEGAELVDYRPGHVRRLAREGTVKSHMVGNLYLVNKADLLAYRSTARAGRPRKDKGTNDRQ
ncbi:MAG: helix-turn-helix domain-containing protein [Chloroflexi bacterium]|nr:helix-turn-helix domain-containing protein [Chloroflexota bacterium]